MTCFRVDPREPRQIAARGLPPTVDGAGKGRCADDDRHTDDDDGKDEHETCDVTHAVVGHPGQTVRQGAAMESSRLRRGG